MKYNPLDVSILNIQCDFQTGERCGSGGFQVISANIITIDGKEIDITKSIDQGKHYFSSKEVAEDLGLNYDHIDIGLE